jgi:hypothetical protein
VAVPPIPQGSPAAAWRSVDLSSQANGTNHTFELPEEAYGGSVDVWLNGVHQGLEGPATAPSTIWYQLHSRAIYLVGPWLPDAAAGDVVIVRFARSM